MDEQQVSRNWNRRSQAAEPTLEIGARNDEVAAWPAFDQ
jgi:hypothetical protein